MYHFFTEPSSIGEKEIRISGSDVNHIKNVLRMRIGEKIGVSNGLDEIEYICSISAFEEDEILLDILEVNESDTELPVEITLYQGLPKSDKMEMILQKAVELGAVKVVPVATRFCVMKVDPKKEDNKLRRWQQIMEAAAKQSKRRLIPQVGRVMTFKQALQDAGVCDLKLIPYEHAEDMEKTRELLKTAKPGQKIAVFIGPEGGFAPQEIEEAMAAGVEPVTLGKRILRTETAGLVILSWIGFLME